MLLLLIIRNSKWIKIKFQVLQDRLIDYISSILDYIVYTAGLKFGSLIIFLNLKWFTAKLHTSSPADCNISSVFVLCTIFSSGLVYSV